MKVPESVPMPRERWDKVEALFADAKALPPAERRSFLAAKCAGDNALQEDVERLLRSHDRPGSFMQSPAIDLLQGEIASKLPTMSVPQIPGTPRPGGDAGRARTFADGELIASRYRVLGFAGAGGMGEVYEVEDTVLGNSVALALKTIRPGFAVDVDALKREIKAGWNVTHHNVCRLYHLDTHRRRSPSNAVGIEDVQFLIMEFVSGETLSKRIRKGRLTPREALTLLTQIAAGLDAAHDAGIIHGDFKSANVILAPDTRTGIRAVITDFGLARAATEPTSGGMLAGTVDYMAPEQLQEGRTTPAADIYALGVVLYEMITQARPFEGGWLDRSTAAPPSPRTHAPHLDSTWEKVILRCLERDPGARFGTAGEIVRALGSGTAAPQRRPLGPAILATVAALLLGAVAYPIWRGLRNAAEPTLTHLDSSTRAVVPRHSVAPPSVPAKDSAVTRIPTKKTAAREPTGVPLPSSPRSAPTPVSVASSLESTVPVTLATSAEPASAKQLKPELVPPDAQRAIGFLQLAIRPYADVIVDDLPVGTAPLKALPLSVGSHRIRLLHPDYQPFKRTVVVRPGETVKLDVNFAVDGIPK
jgi:serine/threonine protein kinase